MLKKSFANFYNEPLRRDLNMSREFNSRSLLRRRGGDAVKKKN